MPDNTNFHLPTDLFGITPGKYETKRSDGNQKTATRSLSNKIREAIGANTNCLAKVRLTEVIFGICNSVVLWFGGGHLLFSFLLLTSM